jgi:hypothetical protein
MFTDGGGGASNRWIHFLGKKSDHGERREGGFLSWPIWPASKLREFLHRMGREAKQGAIGLVVDRDYLEIGFPLADRPPSRRPKGRKGKGK